MLFDPLVLHEAVLELLLLLDHLSAVWVLKRPCLVYSVTDG